MIRRAVSVATVLAISLAACGSDDSDDVAGTDATTVDEGTGDEGTVADTGTDDTTTDATTDETTDDGTTASGGDGDGASGEAVTLRWSTRPDNQSEADVYQAISDELTAANPDLVLEYEPGASDGAAYSDKLKTELAAGTAPDVFWIPGADVADFATRDLLLDLRDLADATDHDDANFYEGPMFHLTFNPETGEAGDVLWGLPRDVSALAIKINLDLIAEAGAEDPRDLAASGDWNWTTLQEVSADVSALGGEVRGFGADAWWGPFGYFINAAGGSFFNEDRTECAFDSAASLEGLAFANELFTSGNTTNWGESVAEPFLAGSVGMYMIGRWATPAARELAGFNWDVVKLPDGPGGPSNWLFWGAYVVNADTEHPEAAWQLVQELTTAEVQSQVAELGANIPSRTGDELIDEFLTYTPPENNQAYIDGLTENPVAEGPLWEGNWPAFAGAIGPRVNAVITGDETLESFADTACDEAETAGFG